ncbi:MAG: hypothetical protein SZ59_C0002G0300 [candidate division TM6 bacterium GW2011_GWF2_28_16]|nr:MAG: hypothetical protein SZ59_C0002G0300 [candidate division TM6 bacterium GW2011_GWF2_28_16]
MIKNKKIFVCFLIMLLGFLVFMQFQRDWGIEADDYAVIYSSNIKSFKQLKNIFMIKDFRAMAFPCNYKNDNLSIFNSYYRPFSLVFMSLQVKLFNKTPSGYFIIIVIFHVLNAILFFLLASRFLSIIFSLLGSLFFLFHISLGPWFGWIATQNYMIALFFCLLSLHFFFGYLKSKKIVQLVLSNIFFFIALLTFEIVLFFPFLLLNLFFIDGLFNNGFTYSVDKFLNYIKKIFSFFILEFVYLLFRIHLMDNDSYCSIFCILYKNCVSFTKHAYPTLATFLFEYINMPFIPSNNFYWKFFLLSLFIFGMFYSFLRSKYKKNIILFFIFFVAACWPIFLNGYRSRYTYFGLPLFIIFVYLLTIPYFEKYKKFSFSLVILICFFNIYYNVVILNKRSLNNRNNYLIYKSFDCFLNDNKNILKSKNICFIAMPSFFVTSLSQFVLMNEYYQNINVYYDTDTFILFNKKLNKFSIYKNSDEFIICIEKNSNNSFLKLGDYFKMGTFYDTENKLLIERRYLLDFSYRNKNIAFITWDYNKNKFRILE